MSSGWVRYIMEQYHFAVDIVYPKDIDTGNLRSKYDVIIFVGGAIPAPANALANAGGRGGGGFGARNDRSEDIPEEFRGRLGRITAEKSVPELKKFLEAGGNVVTIGSSTNLAYHLNLPVRDALVEMVNGQEKKLPGDQTGKAMFSEKHGFAGLIVARKVDKTGKQFVPLGLTTMNID